MQTNLRALKSLTAAEIVIAYWIAQGLDNNAIADRLFVSKRTVETHLYNILGKTGYKGRVELAVTVDQMLRWP
jgi:DNA-binding NarL/FixJ family response regulator